ncbi:MAG: CPBP family intramembrane metalloprotease [Ignavibacteria bacterium]|nr:CPBP family intramembrane metalloprotease [Ignavibacteria bacterium]
MVIPALNIWWVRIVAMIGVVLAPSLILGMVVTGEDAVIQIQSMVYGLCVVAMISFEVLRPNGHAVASGIIPTKMSTKLTSLGILWALISIAVIAVVAVVLGGTIVPVATMLEPSAISTVILFAIGEEVLFRGTIFRAVEERFSPTMAVLATSLPFALVHLSNPGSSWISAVNVFLAGVALGTSVALTRSLWTAIGFHVVWNLGIAFLFGFVSGMDLPIDAYVLNTSGIAPSLRWLVDGSFGVEDGALTSVLLIIATIGMQRLRIFDPYVQAARYQQQLSLTR